MTGIRTELLASYVATASRVGAWAVVSAMLFREGGRAEFADVSVARSSVTLLSYLSLGLGPIVLKRLVNAIGEPDVREASPAAESPEETGVLTYARSAGPHFARVADVYSAAWVLAASGGTVLAMLIPAVALVLGNSPGHAFLPVIALMSGGMLARVLGDVAGTLLQSRGLLALDSLIVSMGEWCWPAGLMFWQVAYRPPGSNAAESVAATFLVSGILTMLVRTLAARAAIRLRREAGGPLWPVARSLLAPAAILILGHLADYCYAPANQQLLDRFAGRRAVADYAPALQVDAALLLLTAAVSTVVLPRATAALSKGDTTTARTLYVRGTLASAGVLLLVALPVALAARPLLQAWLGESTAAAATLLPLVLIHTVIGGSSGIGRAVILAAGKHAPYSAAALAAGIANVLLVAGVLRFTSWGAKGVVAVTVLTVTARCAGWMPWYAMRTLGQLANARPATIIPPAPLPASEA